MKGHREEWGTASMRHLQVTFLVRQLDRLEPERLGKSQADSYCRPLTDRELGVPSGHNCHGDGRAS